jgi:GT2 family glycosyltransferase
MARHGNSDGKRLRDRLLHYWSATKGAKSAQPSRLQTSFFRVSENCFAGYVVNKSDPTRRYVVELLIDGYPHRLSRADSYVEELRHAGFGDCCYGFFFCLPTATIGDGIVAEVRLANSTTALERPIDLRTPSIAGSDPRGPGAVHWLGGLRFEGWCATEPEASSKVSAIIDGDVVATVDMSRWAYIGDLENAQPVRAFDLHLPQRFADGRVHRACFFRNDGLEIAGSPQAFVAYPDGLVGTLAQLGEIDSERLRGALFDRLLPASIPFSSYREWLERFPLTVTPDVNPSLAIAMIGPGDEQATLESIEMQRYPKWVAAILPPANEQMEFDPQDLQGFLTGDASACELVVFMLTGTRLVPYALQRLADGLTSFPSASTIYGDIDIKSEDGNIWPLAFSAFDYERTLEQGYCAHLFAMRRAEVDEALAGGASDLYRLFNMQFDKGGDRYKAVVHLPGSVGILPRLELASAARTLGAASAAHLAARGLKAKSQPGSGELLPAVRILRLPRAHSMSIVIRARNSIAELRACLESIQPAAADARAKIIVIDNGSSDPDMADYLKQIDRRQVLISRVSDASNRARLFNFATDKVDTEVMLLLESHVEALGSDWLIEMQSRLAEPDVAAVGALLVWPSQVIRHAGMVLGPGFSAINAFQDRMKDDPGYGDLLRVAHGCSAATATCLLVSREEYLAVGGIDELRFPETFGDVDLCLKLGAAGKRVVLTPHAKLISKDGNNETRERAAAAFERELAMLRAKWGDALGSDPFYSPILSLDPIPFSALAWPPRDRSARLPVSIAPTEIPPGL